MNKQDDETERYPEPDKRDLIWSAAGLVVIAFLMAFDTWVRT